MSYTESHLLPGEKIKYQGSLHWFPFVLSYLLGLLFTGVGIAGIALELWWVAIIGVVVAIPTFVWLYRSRIRGTARRARVPPLRRAHSEKSPRLQTLRTRR